MNKNLSVKGLKALNPTNLKVPVLVKAKSSPVILPDLQLTIGETPVNLYAVIGEHRMYSSSNLKFAINTGLLVDASEDQTTEDIEPLEEEKETGKKPKKGK
jgi:hypothetical protein